MEKKMNLAPLYELHSRLRTAMIAGTNLLSEDFRLKRAVEDMKPLEALSPVFAKIGQLTDKLLSDGCEDKEGALIDTITLVDAVLCTQGQVAVAEEPEPITTNGWGSVITNAPYSVVNTLVEALTTSGNGHYQFVIDTHGERPELFQDYRIKSAMVSALGAGYVELAEQVAVWLKEEGEEIIPLLQKDFDPKGKKEMVRRVQVMEAVGGEKCNDFYAKMIPEAERDVKNELIYALAGSVDNVELLLELIKKEKGKPKKTAYFALTHMEDDRAEAVFREMYEKKPIDTMIYLRNADTKWAAKMVAEKLKEQLLPWTAENLDIDQISMAPLQMEELRMTMEALEAKNGEEIGEVYRMALGVEDIYFHRLNETKSEKWLMHVGGVYRKLETRNFSGAMAYFLEQTLRTNPDENLCRMAVEFYENNSGKEKRMQYFPAALVAKLISKEDCSKWFEEQIMEKTLLGVRRNAAVGEQLSFIVKNICYDRTKQQYVLKTRIQENANDVIKTFEQCIEQDIAGCFTDMLINFGVWEVDMNMNDLINPNNKEQCEKLEAYFYKRALEHSSGRGYWSLLKKCGCEKCDGLFVWYLKKHNEDYWMLGYLLDELPGDAESLEREAKAAYDLICDGKIKIRGWDQKAYLQAVENTKQRRMGSY